MAYNHGQLALALTSTRHHGVLVFPIPDEAILIMCHLNKCIKYKLSFLKYFPDVLHMCAPVGAQSTWPHFIFICCDGLCVYIGAHNGPQPYILLVVDVSQYCNILWLRSKSSHNVAKS
jgi:hypothetical protein